MRWHAPPAGPPGGPGRSCTPLQQAGPCGLGPQGPVRAACYNPALRRQHPQTLGIHIMASKPAKKNPRLASGRKRVRQDTKLNAANTSLRSKYRTAVKKVEKAVLDRKSTRLNSSHLVISYAV